MGDTVNPYAACDLDEHALAGEAEHAEFELVGDRLRFRSGLRCPASCVITGEQADLVALPFVVHGWQRQLRWARRLGGWLLFGSICSAFPAAAVLQMLMTFRGDLLSPQQTVLLRAMLAVVTLSLMFSGAIFCLIGVRGSVKARLVIFVSKNLLRLDRRLNQFGIGLVVPAITLLFIDSLSFAQRMLLMLCVAGIVFAVVVVRSPAVMLMLCRAEFDGAGVFELRGLRKAFLKRLREACREPAPGA
ncbi:MAG: hypothetical protein RLZZ458_2749 [Planctomycetota bacterium]|jgi:hypothetical protein